MAHSWRTAPRRMAAIALALGATDAGAIALGEPDVRSALGEPLDLRIPVTIRAGESVEPACFTLVPDAAADIPRLSGAIVSLQRSAARTFLRIQSAAPVNDPALALSVAASCPGQAGEYKREYAVLLDPRQLASVPAPTPSVATEGAPSAMSTARAIAATLVARIGDTLESIANAIFPRNRAAKKSYVAALRETNPALAPLGDSDPIPIETPIALPDLRTFARSLPRHETEVAAAPSPSPKPAARQGPAPRERVAAASASAPAAAGAERRPPVEGAVSARARVAAASPHTAPGPGFVLRLSSAEVDMSRTRSVDDRTRAQLRDRQLVLDSDDQVAALLALRNSVRQLESKVAELQLKLSGMPTTFPAPRTAEKPAPAAPAPRPVEPPAPAPPPVKVAAPSPPPPATPVPASKAVTPPPVVPATKPPVVASSAPPPAVPSPPPSAPVSTAPAPIEAKTVSPEPVESKTPSPAPIEPKAVAPAAETTAPAPVNSMPRPVPASAAPERDWVKYSLWAIVVAFFAIAALLAWRLARRKRESFGDADFEPPADDEIVVADEHVHEEPAFGEEPFEEEAEAPRRELDSDVELSTRLGGNTDDLRRRYIEERFPEIAKGAIVLDDPDSVVKGARLFYEDGAAARAIELLQYAIERQPEQMKTWLALFEIFRLERLAGEFAQLARRFKEHHGRSDYWRKVQYFGREIDPGNTLYQEDPINTFETIGPSQARRLAAGDASFDPIAENWLGAPMDFENEVLANELRKTLMAAAGINEQDLVPNPMPALRNVEMFTVA